MNNFQKILDMTITLCVFQFPHLVWQRNENTKTKRKSGHNDHLVVSSYPRRLKRGAQEILDMTIASHAFPSPRWPVILVQSLSNNDRPDAIHTQLMGKGQIVPAVTHVPIYVTVLGRLSAQPQRWRHDLFMRFGSSRTAPVGFRAVHSERKLRKYQSFFACKVSPIPLK